MFPNKLYVLDEEVPPALLIASGRGDNDIVEALIRGDKSSKTRR